MPLPETGCHSKCDRDGREDICVCQPVYTGDRKFQTVYRKVLL